MVISLELAVVTNTLSNESTVIATGLLGIVAKEDITPAWVTLDMILELVLITYRLLAESKPISIGLVEKLVVLLAGDG